MTFTSGIVTKITPAFVVVKLDNGREVQAKNGLGTRTPPYSQVLVAEQSGMKPEIVSRRR